MAVFSPIYAEIFNILKQAGFKKTCKSFKKESGYTTVNESSYIAPLEALKLLVEKQGEIQRDTLVTAGKITLKKLEGSTVVKTVDISSEAGEQEKSKGKKKLVRNQKGPTEEDVVLKTDVELFVNNLKRQRNGEEPIVDKEPKLKKRKVAIEISPFASTSAGTPQQQSSNSSDSGTPVNVFAKKDHFTRIDESKWANTIKNKRLLDQSYATKGGDEYASKAAQDLGRVRGKDFRREMHKKKRASWKGAGPIDDKINSIQFDSD